MQDKGLSLRMLHVNGSIPSGEAVLCIPRLILAKATFACMCRLRIDMRPSWDSTFIRGTWHAMGLVDTGPSGSPSKPCCTCDRHGTAPRYSCVYGRERARNTGRKRRDFVRSKWHSVELFSLRSSSRALRSVATSLSAHTCADLFQRAR